MALNGIPISDDQCIGDSLDTINDSFVTLDSRTLALSSSIVTNYSKLKFTGNGSATFNVSSLVGSQTNAFMYRVDINGVVQEPGTYGSDGDYYLYGGNLIFSIVPPIGTKIIIVGPLFS
jgi:hypothetical protein